ncbi:Hydroxypyruvate reductase [bioreactor metagenome]|uniref:Hydroxypyruvate reductase n=2 Tax=root TaxID=1 RepID=A0A645CE09_9ZZZZ
MTSNNLKLLRKCKIIVRFGIGVDEVDIDAATRQGIIVCNVPDYCQSESADHTIALALGVSRKMHLLYDQTRSGFWDASVANNAPRNYGKIFALVGCGSTGRMVAERAQAFGMKVVAEDPYIPDSVFISNDIKRYKNLDEMLSVADFVSLHLPLNEKTEEIINKKTLTHMKPSSYLINISRGGLVNEDDLYEALINGCIAGAGLDVLRKEPPDGINRLATLPNVIITPHTAWNSKEALPELRTKVATEIVLFFQGLTPCYVVNKSLLR